MKKKILLLWLFISITKLLSAQDHFLSVEFGKEIAQRNPKNVMFLKDTLLNSYFLANDRKFAHGFKFDKDNKLLSKIDFKNSIPKYLYDLESIIQNNQVFVLRKNRLSTFFYLTNYDFKNKNITTQKFSFDLETEVFLQSCIYRNICHLFSFDKKTEKINIRKLNTDGSFTKETILIKNFIAANNLDSKKIFKQFSKNYDNRAYHFDASCATHKMYSKEESLIWTIDIYKNLTILIEIDLKKLEATYNIIDSELLKNTSTLKSNSFLFEKYIAQLSLNKEVLMVSIKDRFTQNTIKSFTFHKGKNPTYLNSPYIYYNSHPTSKKTLFKSNNHFFRKVSRSNPGVLIRKRQNGYEFVLGGTMFYGGGTGNLPQNPNSLSQTHILYGYKYTIGLLSNRFHTILDNSFNHISGVPNENKYAKISTYGERLSSTISDKTFPIGDNVFFGFYNKSIQTYELIKF